MTGTVEQRVVRLGDLDEDGRAARFAALQERLLPVWDAMRRDQPGESIVVLPAVSPGGVPDGAALQALEERFLFLLFLLRQPRLRIVFVTGRPIPEEVVEYYLALLPGVIPSQARRRLDLVAAHDGSARSLAEKLLERPRVLEHIRALIPDPARCHLVPYAPTALERDIALTLGIPLYGADPRLLRFGTKTGCRRVFAQAGVRHPLGEEALHTVDDVVGALGRMRAQRPAMAAAIVKLDEGAAGRGNALVDLDGLSAPGSADERDALRGRVEQMRFEGRGVRLDGYLEELARSGGIVEERVSGTDITSPSVQLRITPRGDVEVLSTHDQVLGGPSGQSFMGCRFPAAPGYAAAIAREAEKVGDVLAAEGVLGRLAVDFVVVRSDRGDWEPYAIEVNLRKGGTTHPFLTLQFLTDGRYDAGAGRFTTPVGVDKHLVATDHLESPALRGLTVGDVFELAVGEGLHFDHARQAGVVFHMLGALTELGRVGLTAVADTADEADALFARAERALLDSARSVPEPVVAPLEPAAAGSALD